MPGTQNLLHAKRLKFVGILCIAGSCLNGCASVTPIQLDQKHPHLPLKILVIPAPVTIAPNLLGSVVAPDSKNKLTYSSPAIVLAVKHIHEQAFASMDTALASLTSVFIITPPNSIQADIDAMTQRGFSSKPNQDVANHLQAATNADAILKYRVTDYGLTPKSWRTGYIGFEVVTTLAITAAIASIGTNVAHAAAGTYLAQEAVEETAEGYAGFWAIDVVSRPVRIEAELIQLKPVKVIWQTSDTGLSNVSLSRLARHVSTNELNQQLEQSTDAAANDVVSDLADSLQQYHADH